MKHYEQDATLVTMSSAHSTPDDRFRQADALLADSWRIAEAARRTLADPPALPPWLRGRAQDARGHRAVQRRLRQLLGRLS